MPVRFLSEVRRQALSGFPAEVDEEVLDGFFVLGAADLAEVRRRHGATKRLGWALQLCALRMLGFCPDDVRAEPSEAVGFVARQLDVDPAALGAYGQRAQTRQDHAGQVRSYLGFRLAGPADMEPVRAWLREQALVSDRPIVLFRLACEKLYELGLVRPGVAAVEQQLVGVARQAARQEVHRRLGALLTTERRAVLDSLLVVDDELGITPVRWLGQRPVAASPKVMLAEIDKLVFLRGLGVEGWDVSVLPAKRVTALARWVESASNQAVAQSSPERRHPGLVAFGAERLVEVTDGLVDLFDRMVADINAKARGRLREYRQSVAAAANDKVLLLAEIARVLLDPDLDDDARLDAVFDAVPKDQLAHALADCERIARPADDHYVDLLGDHYSQLRACVPRLLDVLAFRASRAGEELIEGLEVLRELNRAGRRRVPPDAPLAFVPKQWLPFALGADDKVSRRFWELALLRRLRDGLRSGEVWLDGSQRWADPETYLLDKPTWAGLRREYCATVERPSSARARLDQLGTELDAELAAFAEMLEAGNCPARLNGDRLVVPRDVGDDLPASVAQLKAWVKELLPTVELAEVVIQVDAECGFSEHLVHAAGAKPPTPDTLVHLYAAILAQATNLGPEAMARASGLSYEQIAHATAWYVREETLVPATDVVVDHHHGLPVARLWGDGTFSSSDGQRFPVQVQTANAVALPRYFGLGRGVTAYTWVADHYATYAGFSVADEDIAHLGPTMCEHINVHGRYHFNLGQPPKSLRPLMKKTPT